ncbi:MAG: carboxypeptidase-like regulatory domain-containing protein, partial [Bacteroidales bacterium]|nr:carboxypeptidase-like regulatory domain-containing protein [Bacteroidales bacterium]
MKNLRHLLCIAAAFIMCSHAYAQKAAVVGTITDKTGQPVAGASVIDMQDKTNGAISDAEVGWSLTWSPATALDCSVVGLQPVGQAVAGRTAIIVVR